MNIPLGNDYRLSADKHQWTVQRRSYDKDGNPSINKDGSEVWTPEGYYVSAEQAIREHAGRRIRTAEAETLCEALAQVERIVAELTEALDGKFTITSIT